MSAEEDCNCEEGAPAWMATFSDMATLLLTFFVLLLSFANMDLQNFRVALGSVKEAFGVQFTVYGDVEAMSTTPVELSDTPSHPKVSPEVAEAEAVKAVKAFIDRRGMKKKVKVVGSSRGIVLRMKDVVLFDTGSDQLKKEGEPVLDLVADLFGKFSGDLYVEGHTDDRPIHTERFPSNWELSTGRATAVLRYLTHERKLPNDRLGVAGYADVRPVLPNKDNDSRAQNRRVEFVFDYKSRKGQAKGIEKNPKVFRLPYAQHTQR